MSRTDRSTLIAIAAEMLAGREFLSPYTEDHPIGTPKRILTVAAKQAEQLRQWAVRIRSIADIDQ